MRTLASMIVAAMETKGYRVDRAPGEVNIVYVEGMGLDGKANGDRPNEWNDLRTTLWFEYGEPKIDAWDATTEPGIYFTKRPLNPKGAARIEFGQYQAWRVGMHRGDHDALRQSGGPVRVRRDANKDMMRTGDAIDEGDFWINQHWGYDQPEDDIGKASAGCLVGRTREGHREFMARVKSDPRYQADPNFVFSTTILAESDVLAEARPRPKPDVTELRRQMAQAIVDFEARRDRRGRLAVYALPRGDGGGSYEVAGINNRYHPRQAARLKSLIDGGQHKQAEDEVRAYLLAYTDIVADWYPPGDPGVEFYLRDCAFNRGPSGAARILQRAVGVREDGVVGDVETRPASSSFDPLALLRRLRDARESYERNPVGRDENSKFWAGLENRWDKALAAAKAFSAEPQPEPTEPEPPEPEPDEPSAVDTTLAEIRGAIRPILERAMNLPAPQFRDPRVDELLQRLGKSEAKPEPILSPIDRLLGGRVTTGYKTLTGVLGLIGMFVGADTGAVDQTDQLFGWLVGAFGALAGAGALAKVDRWLAIADRGLTLLSDLRGKLDAAIDKRLAEQ